MGVYISPWDRNHPLYGTPAYNDVYLSTMKELLTNYGNFFELWWDGANGEGPNGKKQDYDFHRFEDSALTWQPQLVIFSDIGPGIRWCGNENGFIGNTNWNLLDTAGFKRGLGSPSMDTLNQGNVNGKHWIPAEADVSIRPGWFYHESEDNKVKTPETLYNIYLHSVGNGGNLLLNVPPDRTGRINGADSASLMGFRELRDAAFRNNILKNASIQVNTNGGKNLSYLTDENSQTYWASGLKENTILTFSFPEKRMFNMLVLEEMISLGQRVSSFSIEAWDGQQYQIIYTGTTIGRKKMAVFPDQLTNRIRLVITKAKEVPILRSVAAFKS